jgi:hypothetical protein
MIQRQRWTTGTHLFVNRSNTMTHQKNAEKLPNLSFAGKEIELLKIGQREPINDFIKTKRYSLLITLAAFLPAALLYLTRVAIPARMCTTDIMNLYFSNLPTYSPDNNNHRDRRQEQQQQQQQPSYYAPIPGIPELNYSSGRSIIALVQHKEVREIFRRGSGRNFRTPLKHRPTSKK